MSPHCTVSNFVYDDDSTQLFGKREGRKGAMCLSLVCLLGCHPMRNSSCLLTPYYADVRRGEYLSGLLVRAGFWIDGVQILSSLGRKSPMFGNAHGGSAYVYPCLPCCLVKQMTLLMPSHHSHNVIPPRGYSICGISGSCGAWVDGLSVLIKR